MTSEYDKNYYSEHDGRRWVTVEHANAQLNIVEDENNRLAAELEQAKSALTNEREQHIAATQLHAEFMNEVHVPLKAELEQVKGK